jgi:hypothetical protein
MFLPAECVQHLRKDDAYDCIDEFVSCDSQRYLMRVTLVLFGGYVMKKHLTYDYTTGTYTFKRTVNGSTYALGINGQSTSSGAYANWSPYSANNASQKWYLETANYRSGDANYNGVMQENDNTIALQYLSGLTTLSNNLQAYLLDANKDNIINVSDAILIAQLIAES